MLRDINGMYLSETGISPFRVYCATSGIVTTLKWYVVTPWTITVTVLTLRYYFVQFYKCGKGTWNDITDLLIPWNRVLMKKAISPPHPFKIPSNFCETPCSRRVPQSPSFVPNLSWMKPVRASFGLFKVRYCIIAPFTSIPPSGFLLSSSTRMLCAFRIYATRTACPYHLKVFDLMVLIVVCE